MLSDADKERIREEEIFRLEVRRTLEKRNTPTSRWGKILNRLNQPIGIWFLSAIVAGGLSATYKWFEEKQIQERAKLEATAAEQHTRRDLVRRLDNEITLRVQIIGNWVKASVKGKSEDLSINSVDTTSFYPEFKDRTMTSLLFELAGLLDDENESREVKSALNQWFIIQKWESDKAFREKKGHTFDLRGYVIDLYPGLFINRWRKVMEGIQNAK